MSDEESFVVPAALLQAIANYLVTKPYQEVAQFLRMLSEVQAKEKKHAVQGKKEKG